MTKRMGLFGSALSGWSSRTTNTGIADTAEGGGIGTFWTFNGASIDHLLTSNNGGAGGQNFGSAVHSAGPITITFNGESYSAERLKRAITAAKDGGPMTLLLKRGDRYLEVPIGYAGGLRYPWLERVGEREAGLDRLLAPRTR